MDLQTRKIQFIQEFLKTANSSILEKLENLLSQERKKEFEEELKPMTLNQYEKRIKNALDEYKNKRLTNAKKLKRSYVLEIHLNKS